MKRSVYTAPHSERVMIENACVLANLSVGEGGEAGDSFEAQSMRPPHGWNEAEESDNE